MTRIEFFRRPWIARLLQLVGSFPVNRQGVALPSIRTALSRLARGEVVGLFVEGEIKTGADVLRAIIVLAKESAAAIARLREGKGSDRDFSVVATNSAEISQLILVFYNLNLA